MKQLLIISGKGGTGKTTVASAFIALAEAQAYADCDVDAPNLHLVMPLSKRVSRSDFYGLPKAVIDSVACIQCGQCQEHCRFAAIQRTEAFYVDPFSCEGCGVCTAICPVSAVSLQPAIAGELELNREDDTIFSTARLEMGNGTSGKLVTEVKRQLLEAASADLAIIDGSPGIGCPVIASLSGADLALLVAEPSLSSLHDLKRIVQTAQIFQIPVAVCVNKFDTNTQIAEQIEAYCQAENLAFVGRLPFEVEVVRAENQGKIFMDNHCAYGRAIRQVYDRTMRLFLAV